MRILPETRGAGELARMADNGTIVIPRFQRDFVWETKDICDLLISVLSGYYIGSLLFLRIGNPEEPMFSYEMVEGVSEKGRVQPVFMVLDGQQRVTSLYYALYGPDSVNPRGRKTPVKFIIDLNKLAKGEIEESVISLRKNQATRYYNDKAQFEELMLPCTEIVNLDRWSEKFTEFTISHQEKDRLRDIARRAKEYLANFRSKEKLEIPVLQLEPDTDPADVCSIFEKINNTGKALTIFELVHARLYKEKIDLAQKWQDALEQDLVLKKFSEDQPKFPELILRLVCLLGGKECKRVNLINLSSNDINSYWLTAVKWTRKALERLQQVHQGGYGIINRRWLPYGPMIVPLARLLEFVNTSKIQEGTALEKIHKWYWLSVFSERYAGATDTTMYQDTKDICSWIRNQEHPEKLKNLTLFDLNLNLHDSQGSAIYKGVMSLLSLNGATDFFLGDTIALSELEDHHIFPRNFLKKKELKDSKINTILNRTLISDRTNKLITDKSPSKYLQEMAQKLGDETKVKKVLSSHFIDDNAYTAMKMNDYDTFLDAREKCIMNEIKRRSGL